MAAVGAELTSEIACALQHRPSILFLDEPTGGLDPQTRNRIWEFIRGLSRDDHGRIVAEGTVAALRQQTGGRTLEDAFIALTGHGIREDEAAPVDRMRRMRQVWRGRR